MNRKNVMLVKRLVDACGLIIKLAPSHEGKMPIRVLIHNLIYGFENMNPYFKELSTKVIAERGLDPGIGYQIDRERADSPHVLFNKIFVQETFLSYVWCVSFSLTVLYEEVIVKLSYNDYVGKEVYKINFGVTRKAYILWEYATLLIKDYLEWNKLLPNPERYHRQYQALIPRINSVYLTAMKFVLAHEFAHIELQLGTNAMQEKQADERAIKLVLDGSTAENQITIRMGILIGLCSLLFFKSITKGEDYPDVDERIDAIIKIINPDPQDAMWGVATLAYRLWDSQYDKGLVWQKGLESPKDLYLSIKSQVEKMNKK